MEDEVIHTTPSDIILNLAQFRSATLLSPYHADHPFCELSLRESAEVGYKRGKGGIVMEPVPNAHENTVIV